MAWLARMKYITVDGPDSLLQWEEGLEERVRVYNNTAI